MEQKINFNTFDNDNDAKEADNCASDHRSVGDNWIHRCGNQNMNAFYGQPGDKGYKFMYWQHFDNDNSALKAMSWMVRPAV